MIKNIPQMWRWIGNISTALAKVVVVLAEVVVVVQIVIVFTVTKVN